MQLVHLKQKQVKPYMIYLTQKNIKFMNPASFGSFFR